MTLRVAVSLPEHTSPLLGGVALVVAAAKLHAYELHEAALQAKSEDMSFEARDDEVEPLIDAYMLVRGSDMEGGGMFLAGEIDSPPDYVNDVKRSIGRFGEEVQLFSMRPEPLIRKGYLAEEEMEMFADELGYTLPWDWKQRAKALIKKHLPPPVIAEHALPRRYGQGNAMPMEYEDTVRPTRQQLRCACGNFASGADGECNACKRQRAVAAAEALATRLSTETAKRARVSDESPSLQRI